MEGAGVVEGAGVDEAADAAACASLSGTQREAVRAAMREQLLVLTGGPGTGKTYTVKQIVEGWRRRDKRVVLACPTARAATVLAATVTPHPKPQNRPRPTTPLRPPLSPRPRPCPCPRPSWLEQVGSPAS